MTRLTALAMAVTHLPRPPERVLEIGCGEGDATLFLAREFPAARVRGVDPSADAIRAAVARVGLDPEGRLAFKQGRAAALPYPEDLFDLVVSGGGMPRPREAARVLRPGGHLIWIEPRRAGRWRLGLSWAHWRLAMAGFETTRREELAGERVWIGRLAPP
jgi:ubiquinone/menaquinone biosynthesis C-methylase UbiE